MCRFFCLLRGTYHENFLVVGVVAVASVHFFVGFELTSFDGQIVVGSSPRSIGLGGFKRSAIV